MVEVITSVFEPSAVATLFEQFNSSSHNYVYGHFGHIRNQMRPETDDYFHPRTFTEILGICAIDLRSRRRMDCLAGFVAINLRSHSYFRPDN